MEIKQAKKDNLPQLKAMYQEIIKNMNVNNISIWDEVYPCEFFADDIENNRLYILTENDEIVSAFALSESSAGECFLQWENVRGKALYLDRFGVNVKYLRKGIGSIMLTNAMKIAKQKSAEYLRLFVVDVNQPAIELYLKNGFKQVKGVYEEKIDDSFVLSEYGFEIKL